MFSSFWSVFCLICIWIFIGCTPICEIPQSVGLVLRKLFSNLVNWGMFPMLSSYSFKMLGLILKFLAHFELLFIQLVGDRVLVLVFYMWLSILPTPFVEEFVFAPMYVFGSFVQKQRFMSDYCNSLDSFLSL
jgi:hypothetical protein